MKRGGEGGETNQSRFSLKDMLYLVKQNFRCLFDPFVFPVCFAVHKVVHYSEYLNFSSVSPADFCFFDNKPV